MIAARIANLKKGGDAGVVKTNTSIDVLVSQPEAAEMLNISLPSVQRARAVLDRGTPELIQAVERGEIAVSTAATLATTPKEVASIDATLSQSEAAELLNVSRPSV